MRHETQPAIAAFEMEEQASSQVMREPPEARKGKEVNSPLEPPKGMQPC